MVKYKIGVKCLSVNFRYLSEVHIKNKEEKE